MRFKSDDVLKTKQMLVKFSNQQLLKSLKELLYQLKHQ